MTQTPAVQADKNPLARLTPDELHQTFRHYSARCLDLRRTLGMLVVSDLIASGRGRALDPLVVAPLDTSLGDLLEDADALIEAAGSVAPEKLGDPPWVELALALEWRLRDALDKFGRDERAGN